MNDDAQQQVIEEPAERPAPRKLCEQLFAAMGAAPAAGGMLPAAEQRELAELCYDERHQLVEGFRDKFRDWWIARQERLRDHANAENMRRRIQAQAAAKEETPPAAAE